MRKLRVILAVLAMAVFASVFSTEAGAASKKKTYYVPSEIVAAYSSETIHYQYTYYTGARAGLLKTILKTYDDGDTLETVYSRGTNGVLTGMERHWNGASERSSYSVTVTKNGKLKKLKYYYHDDLIYTITYTYKNGKLSGFVRKDPDGYYTEEVTYRTNGTPKKKKYRYYHAYAAGSTSYKLWDEESVTFNKKGYPTKTILSRIETRDGERYQENTETTIFRYKYDKKGNPTSITKSMSLSEWYDGEANSDKETIKIKNKFTYKNGRISKCKQTVDDSYSKETTTITFKYKKIKAAKKFWNMMDGKVPYAPDTFYSVSDMIREWLVDYDYEKF